MHPFAGVLSAYGMGLADVRVLREGAVEAKFSEAALPSLAHEARRARDRRARRARGAGHRDRLDRQRPRASICATRAPMRRWSSPSATCRRSSAGFEAAHRQRYGFVVPEKALIVEALSVEVIGHTGQGDPLPPPRSAAADRGVREGSARGSAMNLATTPLPTLRGKGGGDLMKRWEAQRIIPPPLAGGGRGRGFRLSKTPSPRAPEPRATVAMHIGGSTHDDAALRPRRSRARRQRRRARDHRRADRHQRGRAGLARRGRCRAQPGPDPRRAARAPVRHRHRRRSGHARGLQQSLHVDRRADGRDAREHLATRSTSRSGSTSPARCSTATAS